MATYPAPGTASRHRSDSGSGVGVKILALFLGIAVGVLTIVAVVLVGVADDARDEATATAPAHDHTSSAVSLPLQSYAGQTADNAEELAIAHHAKSAVLPPVATGELAKVHMTMKDMVVEVAPGVRYNTWAFDGQLHTSALWHPRAPAFRQVRPLLPGLSPSEHVQNCLRLLPALLRRSLTCNADPRDHRPSCRPSVSEAREPR